MALWGLDSITTTILAILAFAGLLALPSNFDIAQAKKSAGIDPTDATSILAQGENPAFDVSDFDTETYGFIGKDPYIKVYGDAGGIVIPEDHPHDHDVYVYALKVEEDDASATFIVIDSHAFEHDPGEENERTSWHSQIIVLHRAKNCFDVESVETKSKVKGDTVRVTETNFTQILGAATLLVAVGEANEPDPINPFEPEIDCNAHAEELFDEAALGTITRK